VISGKSTPQEVLSHFLDTFDVGGEVDGKVTRQEFINYYTNLGASIDNDDYFELMIRNAWHISGGEGWSANTANKRVLVTRADGSQYVEEIKNDLGLKAGDKAGMMARLHAQGVDVAASMSTSGAVDDPELQMKPGRKMFNKYTTSAIFTPQTPQVTQKRSMSSPTINTADAPVGVLLLLTKLKDAMRMRGVHGFIGLQRKFRIMDDDGSKSLSLAEFKKAMKEMDMGLSEAELRSLFNYFDKDGSGSIDFEEFIYGVRDALTERRMKLVEQGIFGNKTMIECLI
jgi:calcyphosin